MVGYPYIRLKSSFQGIDADLTSIALLGSAVDKMLYTTAQNTWAESDLTSAGRDILDDANAAAQRTTLGLAINSDVQAHDASLDSIAALTYASDSFIKVTAEDTYAIRTIAEVRTDLGLGTGDSPTFAGLTLTGGLSAVKTGGSGIIVERSEAATGTSLRALELYRTTTGTATAGIGVELAFRVEDNGGDLETAATIGGTLTDVSAASEEGALIFEVVSDSSLVEGMRIQGVSGGGANIIIPGDITVVEDFYIYDAARGRVSVQSDGTYLFNPAGGLWFGMKDDGNSSKGNLYPATDDTYDLGTSSLKWDDVWATNGTIQTSDERRKKDIADLNYGIDEINQLRPISFKWKKSKDNRTKLGLIAQEIIDILPEVVYGSEEECYGINYGDLVPIVIRAIQEQQKQIDELQNEVRLLNG